MNREDIISMAHKSHLDVYGLGTDYAKFADALERFADLVRADERSECAKVCEQEWNEYCTEPCGFALAVKECADAIRARGQV